MTILMNKILQPGVVYIEHVPGGAGGGGGDGGGECRHK